MELQGKNPSLEQQQQVMNLDYTYLKLIFKTVVPLFLQQRFARLKKWPNDIIGFGFRVCFIQTNKYSKHLHLV